MQDSHAVLFHHPLPISTEPTSGSQLRPLRMIEALTSLGMDVVEVSGYSDERRKKSRQIRSDLQRGRRFAFAYAESSTTPMALNDRHHMPLHPLQDAALFRSLRDAGVPIGLFYRDVYWKFDLYRQAVPTLRRVLAERAYWLEWRQIRRTVDQLFIPSLRMGEALPTSWPAARLHALPPGADLVRLDHTTRLDAALRLLYVGSVAPPLYDSSWLVEGVLSRTNVRLTICCRADETAELGGLTTPNIRIVHDHGATLLKRYADTDVAVMTFPMHEYRTFAVPVKLFEAVGNGVPVIGNRGTAAGDIIEAEGLGWTVGSADELAQLLTDLANDRSQVTRVQRTVCERRIHHTWRARAEHLISVMLA